MCPTCHTTLDQSDAAAAQQIKAEIARRIGECWSTKQIEDELVANFGQGILAAPPHKGFDLLAWWLPIAGVVAGAALLALGVWRWTRTHAEDADISPQQAEDLDPEMQAKLDEALARLD